MPLEPKTVGRFCLERSTCALGEMPTYINMHISEGSPQPIHVAFWLKSRERQSLYCPPLAAEEFQPTHSSIILTEYYLANILHAKKN